MSEKLINSTDEWLPGFFLDQPIFRDISALASTFSEYVAWPELKDFNHLLSISAGPLQSGNSKNLKFIKQSLKPATLDQSYEIRIHQSGEILTRQNNWHDFFQVMIWCTYPQTKKLINAMHFSAIMERSNKKDFSSIRSPIENTLTLFDECGAVIVSSNPEYFEMIKNHQWKKLFVTSRNAFNHEIKCFIFGHAMLEKALNPYSGMTVHSILIKVDNSFFSKKDTDQRNKIDEIACQYFRKNKQPLTKNLQPFPVLGVPEWHPLNNAEEYYNDETYFRVTPNSNKVITVFEYQDDNHSTR